MKEFYMWITLFLLILLLVLFKIDSATNYQNLVLQYQQNKEMYEKKTKELEKEIRILKADIYVLQYGYETGVTE